MTYRSRRAYLGSDSVTYAENSAGHVYLTSPASPLKEGYVRKVASTVPDVESLWAKLDLQERIAGEQMSEALYQRRSLAMSQTRSFLNQRKLAADCSNAERAVLDAAMRVLDRKESLLQASRTYGVAAMQEKEAPTRPAPIDKQITINADDAAPARSEAIVDG